MKRVVTALSLAVFALYAVFFAPHVVFVAIAVLMACLCYTEYASIVAGTTGPEFRYLGFAAGLAAIYQPGWLPLLTAAILAVSLGLSNLRFVPGFAGGILLGVVYTFLPWRAAIDLRGISPWWLFFALSINWVGDAAAYYAGRAFGRHKLAPRVSPGKSWEGAIASTLVTVGYGLLFRMQVPTGLDWPAMVLLTVAANVAGQVGDLAESALKRGAGVKDSGTLLPGHGGALDRLDSSLFSLPVVYQLLIWFRLPVSGS